MQAKLLCRIAALVLFATSLAAIRAQSTPEANRSLPMYAPTQHVAGQIRIWGHGGRGKDFDGALLQSWEEEFRKYQRDVQFENHLRGNASAIGGLYTGAADIALMGREIWPTEVDGFEQVFGHKPASVAISTGSVDVRNHDFALVIFVHKDNPLARLTLTQLDAIFGADHRRSSKNIRTWEELGLGGAWADKPIHPYGYELRRDSSYFFEQAALAGSKKWNCDLKEIADEQMPTGVIDAGQRILDELAKDQYGIAISSLAYKNAETKALPLAGSSGSEYYAASRETVMRRQYPLTRTPFIYFNRIPGQPLDPKIKEFISYIVSQQGQAQVLRDGRYLPLLPEFAEEGRKALQ
jgi:phosphate transport system substrate-binding protein